MEVKEKKKQHDIEINLEQKSIEREQNGFGGNGSDKEAQKKKNSIANPLWIKLTNTLFLLWSDRRLRTGLILLLIIAPLMKFMYFFFPRNGFGEYLINNEFIAIPNLIEGKHWFYRYIFNWIWTTGQVLAPMFACLGLYFLFPRKYYPSYLLAVPFGYYLALFIHRAGATSFETFHDGIGLFTIVIFVVFSLVLFIISDKLLFNTHHRKRAIEARIIGLINMPGMSWEDKEELINREADEALKEEEAFYTENGEKTN